MADVRRLCEVGFATVAAKELATQIDGAASGGVQSVNGKTGAVTLAASDVGALPDTYTPPAPSWDAITGKPTTFPATVPVTSAVTATTANSAGTLTTGRTIALTGGATGTSAAFNGSANVSIAVTLATPTTTVRGGVLQQAAFANIGAAPTQQNFNDLLAALRAAGIIAAS
jgi:hypothetical protein